jgi:hypothetical protein
MDDPGAGGTSFRFVKALGLLAIGLGLLVLHRYVSKLTGTGTAAPLARTRELLGGASGNNAQLRKRQPRARKAE